LLAFFCFLAKKLIFYHRYLKNVLDHNLHVHADRRQKKMSLLRSWRSTLYRERKITGRLNLVKGESRIYPRLLEMYLHTLNNLLHLSCALKHTMNRIPYAWFPAGLNHKSYAFSFALLDFRPLILDPPRSLLFLILVGRFLRALSSAATFKLVLVGWVSAVSTRSR